MSLDTGQVLHAGGANILKDKTPRHPFNGLFSSITCISRHQKG